MPSFLLTIKLALRGLRANKGRSFLTMLGIIIGIGSVVVIMAVGAGAQSLIVNSISKFGTTLVGVLPGQGGDKGPPAAVLGVTITTLTFEDAKEIAKLPHVVGVSAYARGFGEIAWGGNSVDTNYSGGTASYPVTENHEVARGRFYNQQEEQSATKVAVLGDTVRENLFGDRDPLGENLKISGQTFTVIGVMAKKGSFLFNNPDDQVFIPITAAQKLLLGTKHLGFLRAKVDTEENVNLVMDSIRGLLRYRHNIDQAEDDDFTVNSLANALVIFKAITTGLSVFLALIAAISLVVGGIGIMNVMLMAVKERTREIGLRKAIGATPGQIKNQFLVESMVLTGVGGAVGIIGGSAIVLLISIVAKYMEYDWDYVVSLLSVGVSFGVALMVGVIFGLIPARKAAQLNPIEALRYE